MTYPHNDTDQQPWVRFTELDLDTATKFEVLTVVPKADDDSAFYFNCLIHSGRHQGKTVRLFWRRFKKKGGNRNDFVGLCKALLPDRWRKDEKIMSYHFDKKCFEATQKEFNGAFRLMVKVVEIELPDED